MVLNFILESINYLQDLKLRLFIKAYSCNYCDNIAMVFSSNPPNKTVITTI